MKITNDGFSRVWQFSIREEEELTDGQDDLSDYIMNLLDEFNLPENITRLFLLVITDS